MFTYPFTIVDNSLYLSCEGLDEFSHQPGTEGIHDAIYGRDNIELSIIIDESLSAVST